MDKNVVKKYSLKLFVLVDSKTAILLTKAVFSTSIACRPSVVGWNLVVISAAKRASQGDL